MPFLYKVRIFAAMKRYVLIFLAFMTLCAWAQTKELPSLHVEGRWLVDKHGNQVVLHGVMDTPSNYFNGGRWEGSKALGWWDHYNDTGAKNCLAYFEKIFQGMEQSKCTVFRLHMDPAWTNDDNITAAGFSKITKDGKNITIDPNGQEVSGEADISHFSKTRYAKWLPTVYLELVKKALNHGMYVVVRPPGVCPGSLKVGDYYNQYLLYVWDIFSQQEFVKNHAGQISIELANEPVSLKNANNQDDSKALHDFFQPIVDKIRSNGFTGVIWAPGTTWQQNYRSYAEHPIEGENIGYAVHDYCGWYGCSDDNPDPANKIRNFHESVPVVDFAPVIITEVDWSPENPNAQGHYNESGTWVKPNYGTWATGSTSKWGKAFKANLDYFGNISMTLSSTSCLFDIDALLNTGYPMPAFNGLEEACGKACMDWYAEYYTVNVPHPDSEEETGDAYTVEALTTAEEAYDLMIGDLQRLSLNALFKDGHKKDVAGLVTYTVGNPSVAKVQNGYICALASGETTITATYSDKGNEWKKTISIKVTGLSLSDFTALSSIDEITAQPFAIVRKDNQNIFYGSDAQNLGFSDVLGVINNKAINGYMFKAIPISGRNGCYLLKLILLNGNDYIMWNNEPGYLNSQPIAGGWCSFILGLNNQYGQDVKDGAVWEIKYEANKGFTLRNMATGKYLNDAAPAKYDTPAYMDFLKAGASTDISNIRTKVADDAVYNLHGVKVGTADKMDALPRGIYIIGGTKLVKSF